MERGVRDGLPWLLSLAGVSRPLVLYQLSVFMGATAAGGAVIALIYCHSFVDSTAAAAAAAPATAAPGQG